jgi:metal-dependent amidase/aminoacylase/carboxypeptidase family protein
MLPLRQAFQSAATKIATLYGTIWNTPELSGAEYECSEILGCWVAGKGFAVERRVGRIQRHLGTPRA